MLCSRHDNKKYLAYSKKIRKENLIQGAVQSGRNIRSGVDQLRGLPSFQKGNFARYPLFIVTGHVLYTFTPLQSLLEM